MGCVLTAALIDNGIATIGHVGDTRLYKFRRGTVTKITHDHSPIGEQEESGALTEAEAMHHQMRNQVYRALGSTEQTAPAEEFVEIHQVPVERDSALLICSDGLSDLVPIAEITRIVEAHADDPEIVAQQLIDAANGAGGKDNISLAFVSASDFASGLSQRIVAPEDDGPETTITRELRPAHAAPAADGHARRSAVGVARAITWLGAGALAGAIVTSVVMRQPGTVEEVPAVLAVASAPKVLVVGSGPGSALSTIGSALEQAAVGDTIVVEPGEYREEVVVTKAITLTSREPRGAIIRAPRGAAAAVLVDLDGLARVTGFTIGGGADRDPFDVGVLIRRGQAEVEDIDVSGASRAGIEISSTDAVVVRAVRVHGNASAILVRDNARPRLVHNVIERGPGAAQPVALSIERKARPVVTGNILVGYDAPAPDGNFIVPAARTKPPR